MRLLVVLAAALTIVVCVAPARGANYSREYSQARIQQIIRSVFHDDQARALCIADYESDGTRRHWSPGAQNGSNTGLFQIDRNTWDWHYNRYAIPVVGRLDWSRMHDALYNARAARRIVRYYHGWSQWSTRGLCGG